MHSTQKGTVFTEFWLQANKRLAYKWDVLEYTNNEAESAKYSVESSTTWETVSKFLLYVGFYLFLIFMVNKIL